MDYGVALNVSQAQVIVKQKLAADAVLSFCPATRRELEAAGYKVITADHYYRALSHAKVAVLIERDIKMLSPRLKEIYQLTDGHAKNMSVYLFHFLCIAYYLYFATRFHNRPGNNFFWIGADKSIQRGDYLAMYLDIVEQGKVKITSYSNTNFSYPHYLMLTAYNRILAAALRSRNKKTVVDFGDQLPRRITDAILDTNDDVIVMGTHKVNKNMYKSARMFAKSLWRTFSKSSKGNPVWVFRAAPPASYRVPTPEPDITLAYPEVTKATQQAIASYVPFMRTEYAIGKKLVGMFRPDIAVSDFAKYPYVLAAQEKMAEYGGQYVMMNHGTHTVQFDPISKIAANLWAAQDRVITDFVTDHVPKSPLTYEIAKGLRADKNYTLRKLNLFQEIKKHPKPTDEFMILHAGNFMDMYYHIPWCKETSEEYLMAIYELLEEMQHIEGAKLVIKLKATKAAAHMQLVQEYIDKLKLHDKVVIDTSTKFSDLLSRTSLVVSNLSGTVEEALINHIPVMVHTYYKKYFHIPREVLDDSGLAPAYLVKERADIRQIIEFTKENRELLFNPELYAKVAWQRNELTDIKDFANELGQHARLRRAS